MSNERMKNNTKSKRSYPSDLTDAQWAEIETLLSGLRKYRWSKRELMDIVLCFINAGYQWRRLPMGQNFVASGNKNARGGQAEPIYGIIDSQSVKTVAASEERGIGGGKQKDESGTSL